MQTTEQRDDRRDKLDAHRDIIRKSLHSIANEIAMALRDVGLTFPIFITIPNSGHALVSLATPLDPSDSQWSHASQIACQIIGKWTGCEKLRSRGLHCAVANAAPISAADVTAD